MPLYEYRCDNCRKIIESIEFGKEIDRPHPCPECGEEMERCFPSKMTFRLVSNNKTDVCGWSWDGYDTNRYWNDVDKERAKGNDVRPTDPTER